MIAALNYRGSTNQSIQHAMNNVARSDFLPKEVSGQAHEDRALPIGYDQTNSQPSTVAFMLELLEILPGHTVLDIGCGSGWTTGILASLVGEFGRVTGTERVEGLVEFARKNLKNYNFKNYRVVHTKQELGYKQESPYDRILVSAAAEEIPEELILQLMPGGVAVIPIQNSIIKIKKTIHGIDKEEYSGFIFVPLIV